MTCHNDVNHVMELFTTIDDGLLEAETLMEY
jgi:hypothetical protein